MSNVIAIVTLLFLSDFSNVHAEIREPSNSRDQCILENGKCSYYINLSHGCSEANASPDTKYPVAEQTKRFTEIEKNLAVLNVDHSRRLVDLENKIEKLLMSGIFSISSQPNGIGAKGIISTNVQETDSRKSQLFKFEEERRENALLLQVHKEFSGLRRELTASRRQTKLLETQLEDSRLKMNRTSHSLLRVTSKLLETELKLNEIINDRDFITTQLSETKRNLSTIKIQLDDRNRELRNTTAELHKTAKHKVQLQLELERTSSDGEKLKMRLNETLELFDNLTRRHDTLTNECKRKEALLIECFRGKTSQFCGFEDPKICGFVQDRVGDDLDWVRWRDRTPAQQTGPTVDHTCGNNRGYYMYFDTSSPGRATTARMFSARYYGYTNQCVQFYYHMFGRHMGTLNVYTMVPGNEASPLWRAFGNQGDVWIMARLSIPASVAVQGYQVVFEGIIDRGYPGDMAVDDFLVFDGFC